MRKEIASVWETVALTQENIYDVLGMQFLYGSQG